MQNRNIDDVRAVLDGSPAIDEMRKKIESFLILVRGAFSSGIMMNLGKFGDLEMSIVIPKAKTVSGPAEDIQVNVTKRGGRETHYVSGRHTIPLSLVIPLWDCTPKILEEAEKNPATRDEMDTYRRAGLMQLQAQSKTIQSGDQKERGCEKCNAVTAHIVVRGTGSPRSGGGMTFRLRWRCLTCKTEASTDAVETGQY